MASHPLGGFISGGRDGTVLIWSPDGSTKQTLKKTCGVRDIAVVDPDSILVALTDGNCTLLSFKTGDVKQLLKGHKDTVRCVAVLTSDMLVSGSEDHTLKVSP